MFKKIILSAVAMVALSNIAQASESAEVDRMLRNSEKKINVAMICSDTYPGLSQTRMARLKADVGDLTFSTVSRQGSLGVSKSTNLNQICTRYYQEVEYSSDSEFRYLMDRFINDYATSGNGGGINLAFIYSEKDLPRQVTEVLSSFASGNIQKTKELLNDFIFETDSKIINDFARQDQANKMKIYENYKNQKYKSETIVAWMEWFFSGTGDDSARQTLMKKMEVN